MKRYQILLLISLSLSVVMHAQIKWPDGKKAAIVLTYDDGLETHRNIVIPQLDAQGIKGTFFLFGQTLTSQDIPEWKKISQSGHELGNHSLYHPCLGGNNDYPCSSLECYSVKSMLREIAVMNGFLYAIDGNTVRTYAYPCGQTVAGGEDYSVPMKQSGLIHFARGGGGDPVITDFCKLNFFKVPTLAAQTGEPSERLINFMDKIVKEKGLGIIVFHGVGGDYLDISAEVHQELVDYLAKRAAEIWVAPFGEVMEHVSKQRKQ
ncbi:peptidoglycan/xylan/chitin deacetylase (PgdA/CDA1 family) [Parabacteroides sp. PF5-5]|uniref:polysaccharide deacetylase family protein n=1 Tax=unclassified Parabacteroides TaxID=2649774 RepID=UPI0024731450|nr:MULTISPECIES: polysaccharide deacetylase family protein [unclassified Parabacteroides]MDH6306058.1 peptidoglycan/xylan/chitin deacetylase (PgdA/CDA1 family) [Parabacteroides sp. PH5-39]MDH6317044.1 peptidoglycan/xylan/chitin deacetylase (PgdA/CDA1 family) [Parabacteroides sp. PF5-13]MDH6320797.1 peptidoglycan/xylan/chitin deacetylase (PgdA/CDA1 family) [Parabacteroides sp. PH5-13]MDH6324501.1 peptidoglycan/xylan/chitin deacetylase (PgdA/CDA1 family) [Parabacteroides sp. PH5-8]MDH6328229.1 p